MKRRIVPPKSGANNVFDGAIARLQPTLSTSLDVFNSYQESALKSPFTMELISVIDKVRHRAGNGVGTVRCRGRRLFKSEPLPLKIATPRLVHQVSMM